MIVSHQFLAWAGLHVIGIRVRILQCVATLENKDTKHTHDAVLTEESLENYHAKSDWAKINKGTLTIYQHDLYSTTSLV